MAFLDVCCFTPTAGGTTDWTYSAAVVGYQSPAKAGIVNGSTYSYRAESGDLSQWEVGTGVYNTGTGVLTRAAVLFNSAGTGTASGQTGAGTKISFSTTPTVAVVLLAEDIVASLALKAGLASPTFTGTPTAPKLGVGNNVSLVSGVIVSINANTASLQPMPGFTGVDDPQLLVGGADGHRGHIAVQSYQNGTGAESSVCLFTMNGTAAVPVSTASGDFVAEFFGHGGTTLGGTPGFIYSSGGGYIIRATEAYTASASGAAIDTWGTPTGANVCQLFSTLQDGNFSISPSSTLLPSGTVHTLSINGGRAGTNAGSYIQGFNPTDGIVWALGNRSAIFNTTYTTQCCWYVPTGEYVLRPAASVTPGNNGDLMIQCTSNTSLTFKFKGSDGVVRSGSITLT